MPSCASAGPPFVWFEGTWKPIGVLLFMDVILRMPFVVLILYAGISTLSPEQLEAAEVDGASLRQRITGIVLPVLRPIILIAFVFRFMDALKIFDEIKVITGGGPGTDDRERLGLRLQDRLRAVQDGLRHRLVADLRRRGRGPRRRSSCAAPGSRSTDDDAIVERPASSPAALAASAGHARGQDHDAARDRLRDAHARSCWWS